MTDTTTRIDHTAKAFDTDLQEITRKVAEMGGLVERQIADSVQALVDRDVELGERVIGIDPTIDGLQREVEDKCILTIARRLRYRTLDALEEIGVIDHVHLGHGRAVYHLIDDPHVIEEPIKAASSSPAGAALPA